MNQLGDVVVGYAAVLVIGLAIGVLGTAHIENSQIANMQRMQRDLTPKCPRTQIDFMLWDKETKAWIRWCAAGQDEAKRSKRERKVG